MSQEESEHNEVDGMKKGADSTGEVMHLKCYFHNTAYIIHCIAAQTNCTWENISRTAMGYDVYCRVIRQLAYVKDPFPRPSTPIKFQPRSL